MSLFNVEGKTPAKDFVARLGAKGSAGEQAGLELIAACREQGLDVQSVILSRVESDHTGLDAVQSVFANLQTPLNLKDPRAKAQFSASTDAYVTTGSLKLLIPTLMDNLVREAKNRPLIENVADLIASDRKVAGNELLTFVEYDKDSDDSYSSFRINEGGKIPVRTIKASSSAVRFYKIGSGIQFTYEAGRRIGLERILPHVNRQKFERTQTEARVAVKVLLEGDGVNGAAEVKQLTDFDATATGTLRDNPEIFVKWLIEAAKEGRPIDTIVTNYDGLLELGYMFPVTKDTANGTVAAVGVQNVAGTTTGMSVKLSSNINLDFKVVISSEIPEGSILGYRKDETLERLEEIGSNITEQDATLRTQMATVLSTINVGFAIAYGESRQVLSWA